jgi:hypothetical protein
MRFTGGFSLITIPRYYFAEQNESMLTLGLDATVCASG